MRYYKCTVLIAVPDNDHKDWSDGGDEGFYLQDVVGDVGWYNPRRIKSDKLAVHLTEVETLKGNDFRFLRNTGCWPEGGV